MMRYWILLVTVVAALALLTVAMPCKAAEARGAGSSAATAAKAAQGDLDDIADIPSKDLRAPGDAKMRYFLIGTKALVKEPPQGYSLLVVLPGGDGSADFNPFVRRVLKFALPDEYLVAEPVAVMWTPNQQITWPTKTNTVAAQKFSTEDFVESVIKDVKAKHKVNARRVFTLSWSSGGPAAYAVALQEKTAVTGSFVAMSVFNQRLLPPMDRAKGRVFYIFHSPDDKVCPVWMARSARNNLNMGGAVVKYVEYSGGHGWSSGSPYDDIRAGIDWLENPKAEPAAKEAPAAALAKLPISDSFETGGDAPDGWSKGAPVEGVEYIWDRAAGCDGKASLCLAKTAPTYKPIAQWKRQFAYDGRSPKIAVSAMVKAEKMTKAIVDVQFVDAQGAWLHKWAAYIGAAKAGDEPATHDWKEYSGTVDVPRGTKTIVIAFQIYGPGKVWFDNLKAEYAK